MAIIVYYLFVCLLALFTVIKYFPTTEIPIFLGWCSKLGHSSPSWEHLGHKRNGGKCNDHPPNCKRAKWGGAVKEDHNKIIEIILLQNHICAQFTALCSSWYRHLVHSGEFCRKFAFISGTVTLWHMNTQSNRSYSSRNPHFIQKL
jgi:hypothetical protein